jgi:opacity protein-like surface antigen
MPKDTKQLKLIMKKLSTKALTAICLIGFSYSAYAGNKDRTGQAGAQELMINPWAQSTGLFALNTASVYGIEAMKSNVGGLALDSTTEIGFSYGEYLTGTNIGISNFAIAQKIGGSSVIGLNVMSMSFGDIPVTDYYNPEGYGTYHPQFLNFELAYAKRFSTHVSAGFAVTFVTEEIGNIGATGASFDGGIQYVTGKKNNFHIGVTLRNIGTNMNFSGNGFSVNGDATQSTPAFSVTEQYPSQKFEMPTYLNIGASYDFYLDQNHLSTSENTPKHKLSAILDFQSNSFNNDYLGAGVEYSFMNILFLRAAYRYENGIGNTATSTTLYLGPAAGLSVQKRFGNGPLISIDYSYRPTDRPANGVQMFGIRLAR